MAKPLFTIQIQDPIDGDTRSAFLSEMKQTLCVARHRVMSTRSASFADPAARQDFDPAYVDSGHPLHFRDVRSLPVWPPTANISLPALSVAKGLGCVETPRGAAPQCRGLARRVDFYFDTMPSSLY